METKFEIGQTVMITNNHPNGEKSRIIGIIRSMKPENGGFIYVAMDPVNPHKAQKYRKLYCEIDGFKYHHHTDRFSVEYGFAYNHIGDSTTTILEQVKKQRDTIGNSQKRKSPSFPFMDEFVLVDDLDDFAFARWLRWQDPNWSYFQFDQPAGTYYTIFGKTAVVVFYDNAKCTQTIHIRKDLLPDWNKMKKNH